MVTVLWLRDHTTEESARMAFIEYQHACVKCGVAAGSVHEDGCGVARCAEHGMQHIQCEPECLPDTWTGFWPGELEAVEYGFFTHFVPNGNPVWPQVGPEHPKARPDLNRIMVECDWDPVTQRFVERSHTLIAFFT